MDIDMFSNGLMIQSIVQNLPHFLPTVMIHSCAKSASRTFEKSAGVTPGTQNCYITNGILHIHHSSRRKLHSPPPKTNMAGNGKSTMNEVVFPIECGGGCSIIMLVFSGGNNSKFKVTHCRIYIYSR